MRTSNIQPPLGIKLNNNHNLSQGLAYDWLLNEGGGLNAFNNCNREIGALTSGAVFKTSAKGNVVNFNGTNSYIGNTNLNITNTPFTISLWIYPTNVSTKCPFAIGTVASTGKLLYLSITSATAMDFGLVNNNMTATGLTSMTNRWSNIVVSIDQAKNMYVYQDGILKGSAARTLFFSGTSTWAIGKATNNTQYFAGDIQNVKVWKRALTPTEIMQLYVNPYCMYQQQRPLITGSGAAAVAVRRLLALLGVGN